MAVTLLKWYKPPTLRYLSGDARSSKSLLALRRLLRVTTSSFYSINLRKNTSTVVRCHTSGYQSRQVTSDAEKIATDNDVKVKQIGKKNELWLYNTLSRQTEIFKPKTEGEVGTYVCGVTAYDLSHIGRVRVHVAFDILYRYLKYLGYEVNYVRNFTDEDDKVRRNFKHYA